MPIFRFRTPLADAHGTPLATQKSAAAWFRGLPAVDAIGRQQIVLQAVESACRSPGELEFDTVGAIEFLDAELAADRGRLITQYVEHADGSAALAHRIWRAAYEICQGFIVAYRSLLARALGAADEPRWVHATPHILARLIHFYGTDAKLRVLKCEPWIPAKWIELHRLYQQAVELGIERSPVVTDAPGFGAARPTIEHEYVAVLLTHLLNTGTLVPREIDWAAAQVRLWAVGLQLDAVPPMPAGFGVDVAGKAGLVRRSGDESWAMPRYLDTRPLAEHCDRAIVALRQSIADDPDGDATVMRQHVAILERLRPLLSPEPPPAVPRAPRTDVNVAARVRTGLQRICHELVPSEVQNAAIEAAAGRDDTLDGWGEAGLLAGPLASFGGHAGERLWRVENRSGTGLRIVASAALGQNPSLGTLVAVRGYGDGGWVLGAVRRIARPTAERIQAGVSIIASRVIAVVLHARCQAREEMGFVVDGVDVSTIGERFDGLYLPPPSRPERPLAAKSLIIPSSEYGERRHMILITTRTVYTVALRDLLERHVDWTWVTIDIVDRTARA